jgi:uncharacterized protein
MKHTPKNYCANKLKSVDYKNLSPEGWLKDELELQLNGITLDLDKVWGSVSEYSDWLGGTENSWERPPYWLDGLVPLVYELKNEAGIEKAKKWIEWTLKSQRQNGDFGPSYRTDGFDETLFWPKFVMLKVLISYYENTGKKEILDMMSRYFSFCNQKLNEFKMSGWPEARGGDFVYSILWLYEITHEEFLLELAEKANKQTLDWSDYFSNFSYIRPTSYYFDFNKIYSSSTRNSLYDVMRFHATHIVNVTMALKQPIMWYKISGNNKYMDSVYEGIESLNKYHGQVTGIFSGDEHLSGLKPTQGTELCSVVEYIFSLQLLLEATGDPMFADILERVAYNALPATITEDFKGHQYDQQANQVLASTAKRDWYNNDPDSNLFGFEPNFGCCLANMHQGWPKLVKTAFYTEGNAIVTGVYMPISATMNMNNKKVGIEEITSYPFNEEISFKLSLDNEMMLSFKLRIPKWCDEFQVLVNGKKIDADNGNNFALINQVFKNNDVIQLILKMDIKKNTNWYHNGLTVERGPLIFALKIKEKYSKLKYGLKEYPYFEIYPESAWNIGIDTAYPMEVVETKICSKQIFSHEYSPIKILGKGFIIPEWKLENDSAGDLPSSPVKCESDIKPIELIPYGAAKLRVSLFPWR